MIYRARIQNLPEPQPVPNHLKGRETEVFLGNQQESTLEPTEKPTMQNTRTISLNPAQKPQTPGKKKKLNLKLIFGLGVVFIIVFGLLFAYDRFSNYSSRVEQYDEQGNKIETCDNILNPKCWTEAFRPQLKQENGFTNALLIGVDTRSGSSGLMNTDSLIAISFNHKSQEFMMISIPRDMWSFTYSTKINAVYALTYKKGKSEKNDEFYYLKEEIAKMTGTPFQYTGKIRFEGLIGLVDKLGGVEICPPDAINAKYPVDGHKSNEAAWKSVKFTKGCQIVTGENALVYARFRHLFSGPSYLASDFSRGHRQQEVINAIKSKALSDNVPIEERAETFWAMFQSFGDIISFDINFEDLLAGLAYLNTFDRNPINIVMDPNFGGSNKFIKTDSNPTQGYTIKALDKTFSAIHGEIANIWKYSAFYRESPAITVRNQTGEKALAAEELAVKLQKESAYYRSYNTFNDAKTDKFAGVKIFDFTNGQKPESLEFIKTYMGVTEVEMLPETYGLKRSNKNEDFLIVVGPKELPAPTANPSSAPTL